MPAISVLLPVRDAGVYPAPALVFGAETARVRRRAALVTWGFREASEFMFVAWGALRGHTDS
jgi:hypothetical protein